MRTAKDLTGLVFGRLTVIERQGSHNGKALWLCKCKCGKNSLVMSTSLTRKPAKNRVNGTKTCGYCNDKTKHAKEYQAWVDMRARCNDPNHQSYKYYGERGIKVDPNWNDFLDFLADVGKAPAELSLERLDVNGNYCKDNCVWTDHRTQMINRRCSIINRIF